MLSRKYQNQVSTTAGVLSDQSNVKYALSSVQANPFNYRACLDSHSIVMPVSFDA